MGRRLQVEDDRVVCESHLERERLAAKLLAPEFVVGSRRDGVAKAVEATVGPGLRTAVAQREPERNDLPAAHAAGRGGHFVARDEVRRPNLVVVAPPTPVAEPLDVLVEKGRLNHATPPRARPP